MLQQDLTGKWKMRALGDTDWLDATVPGSVYADLLDAGRMDDPYWRENELQATPLLERDYEYLRSFTPPPELLAGCDAVYLRCEGLDTLATLRLNGTRLGEADNMHRTWEYEVQGLLRPGENELSVVFHSPTRYIAQRFDDKRLLGSADAMRGFPYLRKAHCMFGWDWGPRLPDAGIWRDFSLRGASIAVLDSVLVEQTHGDGAVTLAFHPEVRRVGPGETALRVTVTAPDGSVLESDGGPIRVEDPQLWWPRGYGGQPLYTVRAVLTDGAGSELDRWERRIGLRTLTVETPQDEWGMGFQQVVNGVAVFAMGADYIPEDNILRRVTPERTRKLLEDCAAANFNAVRVWGGGYYPDDWFYDACDELGLLVWQDFMYACAAYELDDAFAKNITIEAEQNVRRLRHHASLALLCGNNEMEWQFAGGEYEVGARRKSDYIRIFEHILPGVVQALAPQVFYWPSSPSSGGGFDDPNDPDRGDVHYWEVWHGNKPFSDYRNYHFRYASEFGFQSFPCLKTVESFTLPEDRNIFSRVMERHQRNSAANGKILNYLSQTYLYPTGFDTLLYASQLLQAEAIQYGVEHWRRHRGRCMGAIYWQINDCWPVASWASIDYYGRWKALHYFARRFFAPVLLSCQEEGEMTQRPSCVAEYAPIDKTAKLCVSNETREAVRGVVRWALRDAGAAVVQEGEFAAEVPALASAWLPELSFPEADELRHYLSFALTVDGGVVSEGTVLFCPPKHFAFRDPGLRVETDGRTVTVHADAYARCVEITSADTDMVLSDNYFSLNGGSRTVTLLSGEIGALSVRSVYDIR